MRLDNSALRFISRHDLMPSGCKVIAAVSGGADSLALLHFLHAHRLHLNVAVEVAHVHHGLAEARSDEAETCVREMADRLNVPLHLLRADVGAQARRQRIGVELAGRSLRQRWFRVLSRRRGAIVATAHTADDQAETVLMHLLRGSGTRGLSGIAPVMRQRGKPFLVRPFLDVRREDTHAYVAHHRIGLVEDPTNLDASYGLRNKIRNLLLPLLTRDYNAAVVDALCRVAIASRRDNEWMDAQAESVWWALARTEESAIILPRSLREVDPCLRARVYRHAMDALAGGSSATQIVGADAIARLDDLLMGTSDRYSTLPSNIQARATVRGLELVSGAFTSPRAVEGPLSLLVPGLTRTAGWVVRAALADPPGCTSHKRESVRGGYRSSMTAPWMAALAADPQSLRVRRRVHGERWRPPKGSGSRTLKATLNAWQVPVAERDAVPIVASGEQLAVLPGWGVDERFRTTRSRAPVVQLEIWFEGDANGA